jgi:hypothetical protein
LSLRDSSDHFEGFLKSTLEGFHFSLLDDLLQREVSQEENCRLIAQLTVIEIPLLVLFLLILFKVPLLFTPVVLWNIFRHKKEEKQKAGENCFLISSIIGAPHGILLG